MGVSHAQYSTDMQTFQKSEVRFIGCLEHKNIVNNSNSIILYIDFISFMKALLSYQTLLVCTFFSRRSN